MRLVKQSAELIKQEAGYEGMLRHIERCGRVCYKSEDRITDDSVQKFVGMLIKSGHTSVLEHGACYTTHGYQDKMFSNFSRHFFIDGDPYMKWSTNLRAMMNVEPDLGLEQIKEKLIYDSDIYAPTAIQRATFHIVTSRAIVDELTRHRCASFSVESTRFCNYSKDKFNRELTFIIPVDWDLYPQWVKYIMEQEWTSAEKAYLALSDKLEPQQARDILPLSIKSEMYMTAFVSDWVNIIKQRLAPNAHPQVRALATEMRLQLIKAGLINSNLEPCSESSI